MKKRVISTALLFAILLAATACGSNADPDTKDSTSSNNTESDSSIENEDTVKYPEYDLDLGGETFNILYYDAVVACGWSSSIPNDINVDEQTGDTLSDAIYDRNRKIEEMYNCKIEKYDGGWDVYNILQRSVLSQSGDYDAVMPMYLGMASAITSGCLVQLDELLDFEKPWWDEKSLEGFSVMDKTYAIAGDLTFMDKFSFITMFFNKNMAEDYQMDDIYQMVVDYEWTFDKMLELCQLVSADLDNNGVRDRNDIFGFSGQNDAAYELFQSSGETFCTIDKDGMPKMSNDSERAISIMSRVYEFMNDKENFFNRQTAGLSVADTVNMFTSNQVLFIMRPLQTIMELRAMDADFGIIPTPLMDDTQNEYHTSIGHTVAIATCIPTDAPSIENSAAVLDTLAAESYFSVNDTLYDMILGTKYVRDENSTENLDIVFNNAVYDPGCIYAFGYMSDGFMKAGNPDTVASTVESYRNAVNSDIKKLVDYLSE
ncbi:MAG: extracellular solute-binding protein [Clostridiales bacterium]|nr:extracellular solute-binding protein [Clostridiales bacterium]